METAIWIIHTLAALGVIGLVLLQHGKGADMGAAFGSGSAGSLFGSTGASNFLSKMTGALAAIFFLSSLGLTYFSGHTKVSGGVMQAVPAAPQPATAPIKKDAAIPAPATSTSPTTTVTPAPVTTPAPTPAATPAATPSPEQPAADSKAKDIPK